MKINTDNIIYSLDAYKHTHDKQYPPETQRVYSYFESRNGAKYDYTLFFGLQYILKKWLEKGVTRENIEEAEGLKYVFFDDPEAYDRSKWDYILKEHGGRLPIKIKAIPEGVKVPVSNVLMTVVNTDSNCRWLTNGIETLLTNVWYASTVATRSHYISNIIRKYFKETSDNDFLADFYLHDFAQRAVSGTEQAGMGGLAHLVNGYGTDTLMSIPYGVSYYNADVKNLAKSVKATEHSVMSSLGEKGEIDHIKFLIRTNPIGILSVVSDTYSIENLVENVYCKKGEVRDMILNRDGKFVIRPDSPRYKGDIPSKQVLWIVSKLWGSFGGEVNSKGYKVLNPKVGCIYGDSLTEDQIEDCLDVLKENKFSAESCVYGCGSYLLQKVNRDTQRFAFKCSAQYRNGKWHDIYKKPLDESKTSKKGRLKLVFDDLGKYVTVSKDDSREDQLVTVFENGKITKEWTFDEIRNRAKLAN